MATNNLFGTGPTQVPQNVNLGGMAYQDPDNVKIKNLDVDYISQIESQIPDTAVDIFIYDTSKDSDGGAWRKRTTHTSWYNETLNTATRGSRREFPSVAVIVVTAAPTRKLYIYDGDDPDLPMWMVIDSTDGQWTQAEFSSLYALNGIVALGSASDAQPLYETRNRLDLYWFVSDKIESSGEGTGNSYYGEIEGLVNRRTHATNRGNDGGTARGNGETVYRLNSHHIRDVAMIVLPNAPIDNDTGLPRPTIALATKTGVDIITDKKSSSNYATPLIRRLYQNHANANEVGSVDFDSKTGVILWTTDYQPESAGSQYYKLNVNPVPDQDIATGNNVVDNFQNWNRIIQSSGNVTKPYISGHPIKEFISAGGNGSYAVRAGSSSETSYRGPALNLIKEFQGSGSSTMELEAMIAYVKSSHNTGWMYRDIKGAFLSDTDATNVSAGSDELITNGTFDSNSDWNVASGWSISGGVATNNGTGGSNQLSQAVTMTGGSQYVLQYEVTAYTSGTLQAYFNGTWTTIPGTVGTHGVSFTASSSVQQIYFRGISGTSWTGSLDNVSLSLAEEQDRSVNGKGLQVFGTITKSPVATGAELVVYSGFSSSNYLEQPHHSGLEVGTGDYYVMGWFKGSDTTYNALFEISSPNVDANGVGSILLLAGPAYPGLRFYTRNNSSGGWEQNATGVKFNTNGEWNFTCCLRKNGLKYIYMNGYLYEAGESFSDHTETDSIMRLGCRSDTEPAAGASPWTGSLSMWRFGHGAPSKEILHQIFNDEKVLFQENANCTLYGTSDAVTAFGYDTTTDILHVGTSSGRSDFQGLCRINNTTTAVTTAISAQDGFIVEQ